ncbi:MAG: D-alanyl-D-alanine carboxypeptidase/D-alanyl-D-alanine-endopeptidase [bacterium]
MNLQRILFIFSILFSFQFVGAQERETSNVIGAFLEKDYARSNDWGFYALNLDENIIVADHNGKAMLTPASIQKLITTGMALLTTGGEFRYQSKLEHDGFIRNDTLFGNIYVTGSGDPTFGSENFDSTGPGYIFETYLRVLQENNVKYIQGSVIGDAATFDSVLFPYNAWDNKDYGNYYGSGTSGLNFHENYYTVYFKPGKKIGDPASVLHVSPEVPGMELLNQVTTAGKGTGDNVYIYGEPYDNERKLTGTVPLGRDSFPVKGSLPDPAYTCVWHIQKFLLKNDVEITGKPIRIFKTDTGRYLLYSHYSPFMKEIIKETNFNSNNMFAESLLKTVSAYEEGRGTYLASTDLIKKKSFISGTLWDGSGLSRDNKFSTLEMVNFLKFMYEQPVFQDYYNSIPRACVEGTLKNYFCDPVLQDNLRAKSGSMRGVRCYAGYMKNRTGNNIAFCIMMNDFKVSSYTIYKEIENLLVSLY